MEEELLNLSKSQIYSSLSHLEWLKLKKAQGAHRQPNSWGPHSVLASTQANVQGREGRKLRYHSRDFSFKGVANKTATKYKLNPAPPPSCPSFWFRSQSRRDTVRILVSPCCSCPWRGTSTKWHYDRFDFPPLLSGSAQVCGWQGEALGTTFLDLHFVFKSWGQLGSTLLAYVRSWIWSPAP